jgi:hypothetical protein
LGLIRPLADKTFGTIGTFETIGTNKLRKVQAHFRRRRISLRLSRRDRRACYSVALHHE